MNDVTVLSDIVPSVLRESLNCLNIWMRTIEVEQTFLLDRDSLIPSNENMEVSSVIMVKFSSQSVEARTSESIGNMFEVVLLSV